MSKNNRRPKVLLVGGFPPKNNFIFGGQVSSCRTLINSSLTKKFNLITLDSSQLFHFKNIFLIRLLFGLTRVAILFRVPVMVFPRAGGLIHDYITKPWFSILIKHTLGKSNLFLCQGRSFQLFATKQLGFSKMSAPIIPNWTALKKHINIGKMRNFNKKVTVPNILFLGWFENFKGVFELLEAARIIKNNKVSFHLTFAGNGTAMSEAKEFVQFHQLTNHITFAGWVDDKNKNLLLKKCQIFVLPSWSEGFPNAMIEAMSSGLACIVTNVGMITDYVLHNHHALIIKKKNVKQLVTALQKLISNHRFRIRISKNGHLLARKKFTIENSLGLFSDAIDKALKLN